MRATVLALSIAALWGDVLAADEKSGGKKGLSIYFVDTEGGAATLIVTPAGESVLIDSGNPGERDPGRIHRTAKETAGLQRIDHHATTHWHNDHVGGIGRLVELIPVENFYDRGFEPPPDPGLDPELREAYKRVSREKSKVLKAGDAIPLKSTEGGPALSLRCVVANSRLEGEGDGSPPPPSACAEHPERPIDSSDNAKSLGFVLKFGDFEFLDLGDLTWNVEHRLVCPKNRIGAVDVYQVTHHGLDQSNNPALVRAVSPRVAIVNNGPRKGGAKAVFATLKSLPGLEAVFQLHRNVTTTPEDNAPPAQVANSEAECAGEPVSISVAPDGKSYTVQVGRAGLRREFAVR